MCDDKKYGQALAKLIQLALGESVGSRVAAQVLLSASDGHAFQLNVVELKTLDADCFEAAMTVISHRVTFDKIPAACIENGEKIFEDLQNRWDRLHVCNRWKSDCFTCYGSGKVSEFPDDPNNESLAPCPDCRGRGY